MGIEYTTAGNIILDIEDNQKRIKLTLTQDAVLEICKQQLTMLQGGLHAE